MALVAVNYEGVARRGEQHAAIAQLGERTTEDRKVPGSIPGCGTSFSTFSFLCVLCTRRFLYKSRATQIINKLTNILTNFVDTIL